MYRGICEKSSAKFLFHTIMFASFNSIIWVPNQEPIVERSFSVNVRYDNF